MKTFPKKGVLLFAAAMAVCAFAMPSITSASSWGVVGSHHTLIASNFGFTSGGSSWSMCAGASFTARVVSTANLEITASTFATCTLVAPTLGATCTATMTGTFATPWTATAVTTNNIQIHGVDIDTALVDDHVAGSCGFLAGQSLRITGTLTGARWTGNGVGQHSIEVLGASATGLVSHTPFGTLAVAPTGTIGDTTLTVTTN